MAFPREHYGLHNNNYSGYPVDMNAKAQDLILASEALTEKQRAFAQYYVEYRNASTAYMQVYDVGPLTKPSTIHRSATALLSHVEVAAYVHQLRERRESEMVYRARELFGDLLDIAAADPNRLIRHSRVNCRYCNGTDYGYQWQEAEWAIKAAEAYAAEMPAPSDAGGFGYDPTLPPNATCPRCYGQGIAVVHVADTDTLDARTRKLYKGIKLKGDGSLEVLMHDQADARKEIAKILGVYKADGKGGLLGDLAAPKAIERTATAEDATAAYLDMVQ